MTDAVRFTETMAGWVSSDVEASHEAAEREGRRAGRTALFVLTVVTTDVARMVAEPDHRAPAFGCVLLPALHPEPLRVEQGHLDLFVDAAPHGRVLHMRYGLRLRDAAGRGYHLRGIKEVVRRRWWPTVLADTTTLFVDVWAHDAAGAGPGPGRDGAGGLPGHPPLLRGILRMGPGGVLAQGLSFRGAGRWLGLRGIARYLGYYARRVAGIYLGPRALPLRPGWAGPARGGT